MKYKVKITGFKFGVPLGFMGYNYSPEQFILVGVGKDSLGSSIGVGAEITAEEWKAIRKKANNLSRGTLFILDGDSNYIVPYVRILIKLR